MINTIQENEIFNLADKVDYQDFSFNAPATDGIYTLAQLDALAI